ncbi:MAG: hypothetical protein EPN79_10775 [Burkholderiaceae bacterium]|nr:MAG: hypothetical protein EPN79_10775 [Burkholderiaceae bacterium]TBR76829.1 MAG: hypothetical protein EPN64_06300 [Burkholderiaceae bacterium]
MDELNTDPAYPLDQMLELDSDKQAVLLRTLQKQGSDFLLLHNLLKESPNPVPREVVRCVLSTNESRLKELCALTGVELDTASEIERRYADIRRANERVRELERELGKGGSPKQTAAHLKVLSENLSKWWRSDGFGHVSEILFTDWGHAKAELSCHLFGGFRLVDSPTPVSDEANKAAWMKALQARGFVLHAASDGRDTALVDCDASRAALERTIAATLPSAKISKTENHYDSRSCQMILKSVNVFVYDLDDLQGLKPSSVWEAED